MMRNTIKRFSMSGISVGNAAMLLALTWNLVLEDEVKGILTKEGFKYVVTEVGGVSSGEFQEKAIKAVMGASLNQGIIDKNAADVHALLHATAEAKRGILVNNSTSTSLAVKIAVVRKGKWIAVALFGQSAIHPLTNHERAGLGVMHI